MKKATKLLALVLACLMMTSILSGCGSNGTTTDNGDNGTENTGSGEPEYVIGGSQGAQTVELMKHLGYSDAEIEEAIASGAATGETKLKKL